MMLYLLCHDVLPLVFLSGEIQFSTQIIERRGLALIEQKEFIVDSIFDYIKWRGDLSFSENTVNEIDNMIFNMLVYIDFDKIGKENSENNIDLKTAEKIYFSDKENEEKKIGIIIPTQKIYKMFREMVKYRRFAEVEVSDFVNDISIENEYQFCAVTFHLSDKLMFVSFRGTDDTIVGWHEDFNLSYIKAVPSQRFSVEYLNKVASKYPEKNIYVGGHSKGGNLAVYSAVHCDNCIKERIIKVYNNDGPGFSEEMIQSDAYKEMEKRLVNFVPQSSMVGMMFSHGKIKIVKSRQKGIFQHDGFSWELYGPRFIRLEKLSNRGVKNERQFKASMSRMSLEDRQKFVTMFFDILGETGAKTLEELTESSLKNISVVLKTINSLDKPQKEMMQTLVVKLLDLKGFKKSGKTK